ncbi:hypothetical protein R3I93_017333 [Phoxinus phoxinus]|uniref:Uncharacterized protein n=1 Tax=Phoxinus phoxinus TaxID=58324 RepID=A0AAN9GXH9_9TELE
MGTQGNTNEKSFICNNTGTITSVAGGVAASACMATPVPVHPIVKGGVCSAVGDFAKDKTSSYLNNSVCNPTSNGQK